MRRLLKWLVVPRKHPIMHGTPQDRTDRWVQRICLSELGCSSLALSMLLALDEWASHRCPDWMDSFVDHDNSHGNYNRSEYASWPCKWFHHCTRDIGPRQHSRGLLEQPNHFCGANFNITSYKQRAQHRRKDWYRGRYPAGCAGDNRARAGYVSLAEAVRESSAGK
jgi:hypothetical protein